MKWSPVSLVVGTEKSVKTMGEVHPRTLTWIQPSRFQGDLELLSGEVSIATLRWENPLFELASTESKDGKWTFKGEGLLHHKVIIRNVGTESEIAKVHVKGTGTGL